MTKFINKLDLQIRMHLATRHLLSIIIVNYKIPINYKLEVWPTLDWEEFFNEIISAGISFNNESDKISLKAFFEAQKKRVLSIKDEINRLDKMVADNKVKSSSLF